MKLSIITITILTSFLSAAKGQEADTSHINAHLRTLTKTAKPRNHKNIDQLNRTANYIFNEFSTHSDSTYFQEYTVKGKVYKNVVAIYGIKNKQAIIIGAHYDVCDNQEGADDNASGVVGLLELSRMLKNKTLNYRIELVAYTLEEPPYFRTEQMGSHIHAKSLIDNKIDVYGMACLEMIGYFDESKKSQDYPIGLLSLFYGNQGNYITLVNKLGKGKFARKFSSSFKQKKLINTKKFFGPKWLQGIDFSDHLNYWKYGFSAVMITDTAFYRNKNYHKSSDRMETLNIAKMAQVINSTYLTITSLD